MPGVSFQALLSKGGGGAANPTMAFVVGSSQVADGATQTYSTLSLGVAATNRKIIVGCGWQGTVTLSSATIGGVAATIVLQAASSSVSNVALIIADVPTGTTGDVVLTLSGSTQRSVVGVYRVVDLTSSTAHATSNATSSTAGVITGSLNVPANGFAIAAACTADGSAWTWTAPTEDYDQFPESNHAISTASASYVSAQTPLSVSTTCGTGTRSVLVVASWGN